MPKKNVYISEELDALLNSHEGMLPLASIFQSALISYLHTGLCPTCGQATALKKKPVPAKVKTQTVPNRKVRACRKLDAHKEHNYRRADTPYHCEGR